ncbi:hypothetical protein BDD12DRAFT_823277 [Trichophaea hybrida]|nr:hypothetical protein BDD12DRAFT_823277 [Trichophaea hybrida]
MTSLVLENAIGTIYNIVYGMNGQRGIMFFEKALLYLKQAMSNADMKTKCEQGIFAISATLFNTINLNQDAVVQNRFKDIATSLNVCLDEFPTARRGSLALRSAERDIQRIKERLRMGDTIPSMAYQPVATSFPEFQMQIDPPGDLSLKGPRHDNDFASIDNIKILPTTGEIKSDRAEFLPLKNKNTLHHETGIHRILDSQFRLLREDTAGLLRDTVCALEKCWQELVHGNNKSKKLKFLRKMNAKINIFEQVHIEGLKFDRRKGLVIDASFTQPAAVSQMGLVERAQWWTASKELQIGNLVALVDDTLDTIFLLVNRREVLTPRARRVEEPDNPLGEFDVGNEPVLKDLAGNAMRALISLTPVDPNSEPDQARLIALAQQVTPGEAALVEFPGTVFASFEPVLKCLQSLHKQPNLPFITWLAPISGTQYQTNNGFVEIPPPLYMSTSRGRTATLDLRCITINNVPLAHSVDRPVTVRHLERYTTLDRGQCESLIMSLNHELALVQGPPGTGKSYVGNKLVQILLANRDKLKIGPIICVCYTNHALDQFLEHILDSGETKIIRLGSRSKSVRLSELTLWKIGSGMKPTKVEQKNKYDCHRIIDDIQESLGTLLSQCSRPCEFSDIAEYLETYHKPQHDLLFAGAKEVKTVDEEGFELVSRTTKHDLFKLWKDGRSPPGRYFPPRRITNRNLAQLQEQCYDYWQTSHRERQTLLSHWEESINDTRRQELVTHMEEWTKQNHLLQMQNRESDKRCLEQAHVIGATTTGLATNAELLRSLSAKVLVCEEAAEVLEAHLITAMLPSVQHAILIGDHLQLRPQISRYDLSMESEQGKKYGLDESLFERLANEEYSGAKIPIAKLNVQRRMHPSIASLVRDTLYPHLQDHPDTKNHPEVTGMRKRLFWLDHTKHEDSSAKDGQMQTSKCNEYEANMVVSLVRHLSRQGPYTGKDDIAVITPYLGQLRKLRKKFSRTYDLVIGDKDLEEIESAEELEGEVDLDMPAFPIGEAKQGCLLDGIRIATVDNFQGEEAKVIIVSLVRSNENRNCGFLKTSNRINVLLSRAQHGMYIIGDSQTSRGIPMWSNVIGILQKNDNIGPTLPLMCSRHPNTPINVSSPDDFARLSPEGGCAERCNKRLRKCGHACVMKCHSEELHAIVKCYEDCTKSFSHCDHSCPKRCWQDCGGCQVRITTNITLPCGHSPKSLACHETIDISKVKCRATVTRLLPDCGHQATVECHVDINTYRCKSECGEPLECGHFCKRKCTDCRKKDKASDTITVDHKKCIVACGRSYTTCNHSCKKPCHPDTPCSLCEMPCEVQCTHSRCPNKCYQPCPPCQELCTWSCQHRKQGCNMPCAVPCDLVPCSVRCEKIIPECGHRCPSICGEVCPGKDRCQQCANNDILDRVLDLIMFTTYREANLDEDPVIFLSCGHFYSVETLDGHMDLKNTYVIGEDGAIMGPKSFERSEMKGCPDCRAPLRNIHRYNRAVKGALLDEATKRFVAYAGELQTKLVKDVEEKERKLEDLANEFVLAFTDAEDGTLVSKLTARLDGYKFTASQALDITTRFVQLVSKAEQPYGKVASMIIDARRRRNVTAVFDLDNTVIQHGFELRGRSFQLRIWWAILWNFKVLAAKLAPKDVEEQWRIFVSPRLEKAKEASTELMQKAESSKSNRELVESMIYHAQFRALELSSSPISTMTEADKARVLADERKNLIRCCRIISTQRSIKYLLEDVKKALDLLGGVNFYSFVSSEEKKQIYEAMATEFRGTGHWYYCQNGHPFSIGNCGLPRQLARCPECGAPVGGQNYQAAAGVRRAEDMDANFARLRV